MHPPPFDPQVPLLLKDVHLEMRTLGAELLCAFTAVQTDSDTKLEAIQDMTPLVGAGWAPCNVHIARVALTCWACTFDANLTWSWTSLVALGRGVLWCIMCSYVQKACFRVDPLGLHTCDRQHDAQLDVMQEVTPWWGVGVVCKGANHEQLTLLDPQIPKEAGSLTANSSRNGISSIGWLDLSVAARPCVPESAGCI